MKVAVFNTKPFDRQFLSQANAEFAHDLSFFEARFTAKTAPLAGGFSAICIFVNDQVDQEALTLLKEQGIRCIALRCAGYDNLDLDAAKALEISVVRVPSYSPYAIAEHAVGLILTLNRKLHRAHNRTRDDNFALNGLLGFDLHGKTVGIVGTGKIGECFARIMSGFGCRLVAYDPHPNPACKEMGVQYVELHQLLASSDVVSLHCPLVPSTQHIISAQTLCYLKRGAMLINTSRGGLIDTRAVIDAIEDGTIGHLGLDVYEGEANLFFEDLSDTIIRDQTFQLLQSFPNVVITPHQAFFTREALGAIAQTTLANLADIEQGRPCPNAL
ncbi:MAG: 2-hydroxyacid dehydrogenase [Elainellaceae cyanobacterium]